ncbi:MAG: helix-turn-helix domain-containing protein, partial [Thermanaeromonas sp.]|uniref:IS66 family insertion sequence element accessory protein TnpA n=1 Tax=Thermanaeromonas sp. TaxID=2003697 RepID=UPI002438AC1A
CASHEGISPRQLWYWLRKFKNQTTAPPETSNRWLPIEISEQGSPEQALLAKIGPASIEIGPGFDPALLTQVVQVLIALC